MKIGSLIGFAGLLALMRTEAEASQQVVSVPTSRPMQEVALCLSRALDPFGAPSVMQLSDRIVLHYGRGVRDVSVYPDRIETVKKFGHLSEKRLKKCAVDQPAEQSH